MKKAIVFLLVISFLFLFSSCKKKNEAQPTENTVSEPTSSSEEETQKKADEENAEREIEVTSDVAEFIDNTSNNSLDTENPPTKTEEKNSSSSQSSSSVPTNPYSGGSPYETPLVPID